MSKTAGLPSWSELLAEIATSVGVDGEMLRQLRRLDLKDQANVLQLLLAERASASRARRPPSAGEASEASELQALRELGAVELQAMAVARLQGTRCAAGTRYSVAHALLAALPHEAAVTTNSDLCYDAACAAAGVSVNRLPYT